VIHSEIDEIELKTGLKLPKWYVDIITNYPKELNETDAPDFGLLNEPLEIIEHNNEVRKNGYFGEDWPERYIIIGQNGCGDYWVIIQDSDAFSIGFSNHELMECIPYASTLEQFISKYQSELDIET
jgi:hypothetical protein